MPINSTSSDQPVEHILAEGPILLSFREGIAELRLNRPEASNGLSVELLKAMYEAVMWCHSDRRVKVVLLTGAGKHFCAGGDVKVFASKGEYLPDYIREATAYLQIVVNAMIRLSAPVIAAIQGFAAGGGGFGFVCAVDLVVAADTAKFMAGATRVGMAPDAGMSITLQNLVGIRKAMELILLNPVLSAQEAFDLGLINKIVAAQDLESEAWTMAKIIAEGAPLAQAAAKRLLWNGVGSRIESCFSEEARTVSELSGTHDAMEALHAVIEKRKPNFIGK